MSLTSTLHAFTANFVWFESYPTYLRVYVSYTIPEFLEERQAYIDFTDRKKAATFFWSIQRGADFYLDESGTKIKFINSKPAADPW